MNTDGRLLETTAKRCEDSRAPLRSTAIERHAFEVTDLGSSPPGARVRSASQSVSSREPRSSDRPQVPIPLRQSAAPLNRLAARGGSPDAGSASDAMWLTLVAMTLANSMILVDQTAVPLATPDVVEGLDAGLGLGQWLLTANILPLAALMVLGGRLGDLLGHAPRLPRRAVIFLRLHRARRRRPGHRLDDHRARDPGRRRGADDADRDGARQRRVPRRAPRQRARDPRRRLGVLRRARARCSAAC